MRRILGIKRLEVTEIRDKLHNKELHILYSSTDIIRTMGSVGKPERKRPFRRPWCIWQDWK
jgi:hypothetical protein